MPLSRSLAALVAVAFAASACGQAPAPAVSAVPAISEAAAGKLADATLAAWLSMDAARIKALYAPSIVGFDYATGPLTTDRGTWDAAQDRYASAGIDGAEQKERTIQILASDVFVVSGTWEMKSSAMPANDSPIRCTDVYRRDAGGRWPIVNEHCSAVPRPA